MTGYTASFEPAMRLALAEAELAATGSPDGADVPVGAVVLDPGGNVVARARNQREALADPTAHAEIQVLRAAGQAAGDWRLTGYTLIVTLEPCAMCAGAVTAARLSRLVFGADDPRAGAVGSLWDLVRDPMLPHSPEVIAGVLSAECGDLLRTFFATRRERE